MLSLDLNSALHGRNILCLGAHSDDIEIGCGGTMLHLIEHDPDLCVTWVVFSADETRAEEARRSARAFLKGAAQADVVVHDFPDGHFPWHGEQIKAVFEQLKSEISPDVVFTHFGEDRHQDHRMISELTWNTFRDHLVLEYEIPKYDGNVWDPNTYVPLADSICRRKIDRLMSGFPSQRGKGWFSEGTFRATMRLRGIECNAPDGFAEGFRCRKLVLR